VAVADGLAGCTGIVGGIAGGLALIGTTLAGGGVGIVGLGAVLVAVVVVGVASPQAAIKRKAVPTMDAVQCNRSFIVAPSPTPAGRTRRTTKQYSGVLHSQGYAQFYVCT
jgi:hypothetical protein